MSLFSVLKILLSAAVIFAVTELVKRSDRLGALVASLPFVSIIGMIWIFHESSADERDRKVADHAWYTFWYVLPTLPMFLLFPLMVRWWGFYGALLAGAVLTVMLFALLRWAGAHWGLRL
jgi:hypothetical protein